MSSVDLSSGDLSSGNVSSVDLTSSEAFAALAALAFFSSAAAAAAAAAADAAATAAGTTASSSSSSEKSSHSAIESTRRGAAGVDADLSFATVGSVGAGTKVDVGRSPGRGTAAPRGARRSSSSSAVSANSGYACPSACSRAANCVRQMAHTRAASALVSTLSSSAAVRPTSAGPRGVSSGGARERASSEARAHAPSSYFVNVSSSPSPSFVTCVVGISAGSDAQ